MPEPALDGPDDLPLSTSDLLRTGFSADSDTGDGTIVLTLQGELDMATAPGLGQAINQALDTLPTSLRLDLSELSFLDSTGIRVLIAGCRRAAVQGCSFILASPSRSVLKALRLTGVDRLMVIEGGRPDS
ncbi:MAG: STAS domain-containing protein [Actinomycetes bacterium]